MGTDTMAYTAAALGFMLENLGKPVVLTGSMVPLANVHNDAQRNIVVSAMVAADLDAPEVLIFMNKVLLRGVRATKVPQTAALFQPVICCPEHVCSVQIDAGDYAAFDSPNFPPLATLGVNLDVQPKLLMPQPRKRLKVHYNLDTRILCLRCPTSPQLWVNPICLMRDDPLHLTLTR